MLIAGAKDVGDATSVDEEIVDGVEVALKAHLASLNVLFNKLTRSSAIEDEFHTLRRRVFREYIRLIISGSLMLTIFGPNLTVEP